MCTIRELHGDRLCVNAPDILRNRHTILLAHCQKELITAAILNTVGEFSKRNVKVNMLPAIE